MYLSRAAVIVKCELLWSLMRGFASGGEEVAALPPEGTAGPCLQSPAVWGGRHQTAVPDRGLYGDRIIARNFCGWKLSCPQKRFSA